MIKIDKYTADCDTNGEWFVFDNDAFYCFAGPMSEEEAVELKIKLTIEELNQ